MRTSSSNTPGASAGAATSPVEGPSGLDGHDEVEGAVISEMAKRIGRFDGECRERDEAGALGEGDGVGVGNRDSLVGPRCSMGVEASTGAMRRAVSAADSGDAPQSTSASVAS